MHVGRMGGVCGCALTQLLASLHARMCVTALPSHARYV